MVESNEVLHADKKTVRKYAVIILAVFVVGTIIVAAWVNTRVSVSPQEKEVARSNCAAWVGYYLPDVQNPARVCHTAEDKDPRQFYRRWAGGGNSVPVSTEDAQ